MKALLRLCLLASIAGMDSPSPAQTPDADLLRALERFANSYNRFAATWSQGTFDIRQAKQLSKLWHDVEASGYWPREEKPKR